MKTDELDGLIAMARGIAMADADREAQRRSFVYGNTRLANEEITWETIDRARAVVEGDEPYAVMEPDDSCLEQDLSS